MAKGVDLKIMRCGEVVRLLGRGETVPSFLDRIMSLQVQDKPTIQQIGGLGGPHPIQEAMLQKQKVKSYPRDRLPFYKNAVAQKRPPSGTMTWYFVCF